jgi:hypothetical protein
MARSSFSNKVTKESSVTLENETLKLLRSVYKNT